jgi:hypothetical protein
MLEARSLQRETSNFVGVMVLLSDVVWRFKVLVCVSYFTRTQWLVVAETVLLNGVSGLVLAIW